MSTRMLIDARHAEETRVTVVKGSRVEDFDYESSTRRQLKGNIYLARITRVEPSLQAAFVEYGGNRHGFLAFSEIHPDYYQMPLEDRAALLEAESKAAAAEKAAEEAAEPAEPKKPRRRRGRKPAAEIAADADAIVTEDLPDEGTGSDNNASDTSDDKNNTDSPAADDTVDADEDTIADVKESEEEEKDAEIEAAAASRNRNLRALKRRYSIQEVIKRRQVLLIQVVKEERGNKGAALTTYVSLAGRYCVLMPNSTHSGGISRKISNLSDRKKLKQITASLDVPEDMGLIVRTAGMNRTKAEIKRDYDYLLRLWNGIRELTLKSTAPALIYEEGNLIKRTIRDLYSRDIDEIWVEGEDGYRAAKDFMKLLMPSHAKKVQHYKDRIPLYHRYQVENELEAMYQPIVQLRSGGYIVINPTEALISIDVNSGRATKEHNIEETAVKTNLEAAEEVARQLRLRDMAGLVVIDFIDMEDRGNNRSVERRMKDMLKNDRARIQVGRISSFGLMEMSRQRLRPNLLEASMETCGHCSGTGLVRSVESAAIMVLHQLEEEGIRKRSSLVRVAVNPDVAVYLLNKKRSDLSELESQYSFVIEILAQSSMGASDIEITRETVSDVKPEAPSEGVVVKMDSPAPEEVPSPAASEASSDKASHTAEDSEDNGAQNDDQPRKKRRRRRRRRRGGADDAETSSTPAAADENTPSNEGDDSPKSDDAAETEGSTRRRRGSRGGRRRKPRTEDTSNTETSLVAGASSDAGDATATQNGTTDTASAAPDEKPVRRRRRVKKSGETPDASTISAIAPASTEENSKASSDDTADAASSTEKPARRPSPRRRASLKKETESVSATSADTDKSPATSTSATEDKPKPRPRRRAKIASDTAHKPEDAPTKPRRARTSAAAKTTTDKSEKAKSSTAKPSSPKASGAAAKPDTGAGGTVPPSDPTNPDQPRKKGWWQRTFG